MPIPDPQKPRELALTFDADARDYFWLCAGNLVLSVLTLGVYWPWATVRRLRYLAAHTSLDGVRFEYVGSALPILVTRLTMLVACVSLVPLARHPALSSLAGLALTLVGHPWLSLRWLRILARGTAYRGIPADFTLTYGSALTRFVSFALASVLTLGLALPSGLARWLSFLARGVSYCGTTASLQGAEQAITRAFVRLALVALALTAIIVVLTVGAHVHSARLPLLLGVAGGLVGLPILVTLQNALTSHTALGPVSLASTLRPGEVLGLYLVNLVAVVATLGLLAPWAELRYLRYRARRTRVFMNGTWDDFSGLGTPRAGTADQAPVPRLAPA